MRTTLKLDDDLVREAKALARKQGVSLGQVISELARKSLPATSHPKLRNGVEVFTRKQGSPRVTMESVNGLRDKE
ncbi:MAG TPA: CopG family transcriptional regulator [Bryobacteraceae bacterium]|nr:CopG family transcriptional regulator [Bryobacteraceae bacterium]